jgi:4-hydroxybenzoate polyprenyltransferase
MSKVAFMLKVLFRHVRPFNLILLAFTQILLRYTLILPFLNGSGFSSAVSHYEFAILVFSTVLIAAGGYLINDADDWKIDSLNRKKSLTMEQVAAFRFYGHFLLLAGAIAGMLLSFVGGLPTVWSIHLCSALVLFGYSTVIKKIPLLASVAVALLITLSVLVVYTSDPAAMQVKGIREAVAGYSIFAFMLTLVRETIKDMEDCRGDQMEGRKTLPVLAGVSFSKIIVAVLLLSVMSLLGYIQMSRQQWLHLPAFIYVVAAIQLPLLVLMIKLFFDKQPAHFSISARLCRLIMLAGVLTLPLFHFVF